MDALFFHMAHSNISRKQAKAWCFTLNHPEDYDELDFGELEARFGMECFVYQNEIGHEGYVQRTLATRA